MSRCAFSLRVCARLIQQFAAARVRLTEDQPLFISSGRIAVSGNSVRPTSARSVTRSFSLTTLGETKPDSRSNSSTPHRGDLERWDAHHPLAASAANRIAVPDVFKT